MALCRPLNTQCYFLGNLPEVGHKHPHLGQRRQIPFENLPISREAFALHGIFIRPVIELLPVLIQRQWSIVSREGNAGVVPDTPFTDHPFEPHSATKKSHETLVRIPFRRGI